MIRRFLLSLAVSVGLISAASAQVFGPVPGSSSIGPLTPTTCTDTRVMFADAGFVGCVAGFTYTKSTGTLVASSFNASTAIAGYSLAGNLTLFDNGSFVAIRGHGGTDNAYFNSTNAYISADVVTLRNSAGNIDALTTTSAGRVAMPISLAIGGATIGADAFAVTGTSTLTGNTVVSGSSFGLSGAISAAAWTTSGIRYKNVASTLTDTTSSGTVAAAYTNVFGANTIAASSATTYTQYINTYFANPVAGSNVTMTNKSALGADSVSIGGAAQGANALAVTGTANVSTSLTTPFVVASGISFFNEIYFESTKTKQGILGDDTTNGLTITVGSTGARGASFGPSIASSTIYQMQLPSTGILSWSGSSDTRTSTAFNTAITSPSAATLQHGAADVSSGAVAQTVTFQGNTGATTTGPLALIRGAGGGSGAGSIGGELRFSGGLSSVAAGTGGAITFYTAPSGAGATAALALTIDSTKLATFAAGIANAAGATLNNSGDIFAVNGRSLGWTSANSRFKSPSDGVIVLFNSSENDFSRLQFGGTTSSFPALKRSTTTLQVRLADDSNYAGFAASAYSVGATAGASCGPITAVTSLTVVNGIVTACGGT